MKTHWCPGAHILTVHVNSHDSIQKCEHLLMTTERIISQRQKTIYYTYLLNLILKK
uniref:Uncharacterized protein n=1 Tax=Meloidogyne enterolobii TaxID=390850 RepID=A0A6V7WVG9_MELEN|nr:unnamed protein product [Meloidogyne enterolobii]